MRPLFPLPSALAPTLRLLTVAIYDLTQLRRRLYHDPEGLPYPLSRPLPDQRASLTSCVFIFAHQSPNLATYIVGNVVVAIGSAALSLITTILTADLISLKVCATFPRAAPRRRAEFCEPSSPQQWRAFAQGMLSAPYIVTPWYVSIFPLCATVIDFQESFLN